MTGRYWSQPLTFDKPPLNLNQRLHWAKKAKITKEIRREVQLTCSWMPKSNRVEVWLIWEVRTKRHRDLDNPVLTLKACIDGLRDAGVIEDDNSEIVVASGTRIENATKNGMRLEVREA